MGNKILSLLSNRKNFFYLITIFVLLVILYTGCKNYGQTQTPSYPTANSIDEFTYLSQESVKTDDSNENIDKQSETQVSTVVPPLSAGDQEIRGVVLEGGDQTPEGLFDVPRTYIYQIRLETDEIILLSYIAYPDTPSGENREEPILDFENGVIEVGDYLIAKGTYDPESNTLFVEKETDYIKTINE